MGFIKKAVSESFEPVKLSDEPIVLDEKAAARLREVLEEGRKPLPGEMIDPPAEIS